MTTDSKQCGRQPGCPLASLIDVNMIRSGPTSLLLAVLALALVFFVHVGTAHAQEAPYRYFSIGDPTRTVALPARHPSTSLVLMGGGADVDQAFRWMIRRAGVQAGTGGRFVVLRARGTDAYNPYIYYSGPDRRRRGAPTRNWVGGALLGLSSVETLVLPNRAAAEDPFVNAVVRSASAVFIAGGDQSQYIRFWKGTALERSLNELLSRNVPVGGTSAGLAILGEYSFSALQGSIDSKAALSNPFDPRITLDPSTKSPGKSFLAPAPLLGIMTDSHFDKRDRMGRLVAFLSRLGGAQGGGCASALTEADAKATALGRGIGVSEQAALLIQGADDGQDFLARRIRNPWSDSEGAVYFVRPLVRATGCHAGAPLTIDEVEIRKLSDSRAVFNLSNWSGVDAYKVSVKNGSFDIPPY